MQTVIVFALLCAVATTSASRQVSCTEFNRPINAEEEQRFLLGFQNFQEQSNGKTIREGKGSIQFEAQIGLGMGGTGGVDLSEYIYALRVLEAKVNPVSVPLKLVTSTWQEQWKAIGDRHSASGDDEAAKGRMKIAAKHYHMAATYYQIADRFGDHNDPDNIDLYSMSVALFTKAANISHGCVSVKIPYDNTTLPGYWCPAAQSYEAPTIIACGGFDSSNLFSFHEVAIAALSEGYNVLLLEGPGQGSTSRFQHLAFIPNFEAAITPAVDWIQNTVSENGKIAIWCRSFGGYLCARAYAMEKRLDAAILDGGILDFYQLLICSLPQDIRDLFFNNRPAFDNEMGEAMPYSYSLQFLQYWGSLGFQVSTVGQVLDQAQPFIMGDAIEGFESRPVLIDDPKLDTLAKNASELFFAALPRPLNAYTQIYSPDIDTGIALHSAVGSTQNANAFYLSWLDIVLKGKS